MKLLTNKTLKTFLIIFSVIMVIEIVFKFVMDMPVFDWSLFRIMMSAAAFSAFVAAALSFANNLVRNIITIVIVVFLTIYAIVQAGFNNYLGTFMSVATSSQAGAVGDFIGDFIASFKPTYYLMAFPLVVFVVLFIIFERRINVYESNLEVSFIDKIKGKKKKEAAREEQESKKKKELNKNRIIFAGVFVGTTILYVASIFIPFMQNDLQMVSNKDLFRNPSMPNITVSQYGIENFAFLDIKALIFPVDEDEIEFDMNNSNNNKPVVIEGVDYTRYIDDSAWRALAEAETVPDYKKLNSYFLSKEITAKNDKTGIFKGKNLIIVMIETGSSVLFDYPEYYPNMAKLYNEGWTWTNAFSPRNACSTGNNEMSGITSLYTINRSCTANIYKDNKYFESIFNLFNKENYNVTSYHNYTDQYYYRKQYHPNMGSQKFYGIDDLKVKRLGGGTQPWPSDVDFVEKALPHFIDEEKFMAWMTTVSAHMKYGYSSVTGDTYLSMFKDEKWDIQTKRYMSKLKYVDLAFGEMLKELEDAGRLDDTVIVLYGDHEPYGLDENLFQQAAKYNVLTKFGDIDRTPFIIYNPGITGQKFEQYTSFMNIVPTVANLFDLDYDPRLYGGQDLFSSSYRNVVAFADGSWRTDIAFYDATSGKINYIGEQQYTGEEIKTINNYIKNEIAMDNLAIKRDYFEYLNQKLNYGFKPGTINISNKINANKNTSKEGE